MRALVTGHKGFIGRHLARAIKSAGWDIPFGVDIAVDGLDCREWLRRWSGAWRYDVVFHCAGFVGGREGIEHQGAHLAAYNLQLDGALFEWALRAKPKRIVYFSSSAAYPVTYQMSLPSGRGRGLCESDASPLMAADATYGWAKLCGERMAQEVRKAGIPVTVVRPFSGYGEDQDPCYPFPAMIERAKCREHPFTVWGDGRQVRDFIHVDDIAAGVLALVEQGVDGPVNLGTGRHTSMDELARMVMAAAGYEAPIQHMTDKPTGVMYRVANTTLMRQHFTPRVTLEEGIARALAA